MEEYYIEYMISSACIALKNKISFNIEGEYTKKAQLEQHEGKLYITFYFAKEINFNDGINDTNKLLEDILNNIAFNYYKASIGSAYYNKSNLKEATCTSNMNSSCIFAPPDREDKLKKALNSSKKYNANEYLMFRMAMQSIDVVNRYMFLYQILLDRRGPEQWKVDKYINCLYEKKEILKEDPEYKVWQTDRINKKGEQIRETKFTFIRNKVGHAIKGSTPLTTRMEMQQKIDDLIEIVKYSMEND